VMETETWTMVADPTRRTPVVAAAGCATSVYMCFDPEGSRNWLGCLQAVPTCEGEEPWLEETVCCASGCAVRYDELRRQDMDPPSAAALAITGEGSCMPGVDEQAGRSR